jgi:hypothetical protein
MRFALRIVQGSVAVAGSPIPPWGSDPAEIAAATVRHVSEGFGDRTGLRRRTAFFGCLRPNVLRCTGISSDIGGAAPNRKRLKATPNHKCFPPVGGHGS